MYKGLSTPEVEKLLQQHGFNEIPEKKSKLSQKFLNKLISPISGMLLAAAFLSFFVHKIFDFYFILILLFLNILITLWQENKADDAIKKLNEHLTQKVKVFRNNMWQQVLSKVLVPGDIVELSSGEVIPADGVVREGKHISINESALTGESMPKEKKVDDFVYSGSFLVAGLATVQITATGKDTNFGKTIFSVERVIKKSLLEKDVLDISRFLTILSLIAVVLLSVVFLIKRVSIFELLTLDLSLLIAGIPISLPTVMTLIIEFGVLVLAKKNAIVRRLSALEDLANVNFLLTDKTGTLTKNKIEIQDIYAYGNFTHNQVILYALLSTLQNDHDLIDIAVSNKAEEMHIQIDGYAIVDYIPADSVRKRSTTTVRYQGQMFLTSLGAPQIILSLCDVDSLTKQKFVREVESLAKNGYRSLAVAISKKNIGEENMQVIGLLALSDTLREDAKGVIQFLKENSIGVAMVTGDNRAIASQIAQQLTLDDGAVITKEQLEKLSWDTAINKNFFEHVGAFAEILPEDKLRLVQKAKQFFMVASTGDGVNDLPAIKAANVGIAVKNAVNALKATADIVLLSEGISVIRDAIIESRKIFERIYVYSLYRISESLRLIVTIAILGIVYGVYPMTALQIILLALLNDLPIISLAFDRVQITHQPEKIDAKKRFVLSSLYGVVGVVNSLLLFFIMRNIWSLDWTTIQTMYFLKLTISGHMLIYIAHTKKRWWKFLPSKQVIWATSGTQIIATILAFSGFLMPGKLELWQIAFVWVWALFWMQISEYVKYLHVK